MLIKSAIRIGETIYIGKRHPNCIAEAIRAGEKAPITGTQGFIDEKGNFYNRELAAIYAFKIGQIKEKKKYLFSEDIF